MPTNAEKSKRRTKRPLVGEQPQADFIKPDLAEYGGYASIEIPEDHGPIMDQMLTDIMQNGGYSRLIGMILEAGFSVKIQPIESGVKVVTANVRDIYEDGLQIYVATQAREYGLALFVAYYRLYLADFHPTPKERAWPDRGWR